MKKKFPYRYRVVIFLFLLSSITYLDRVSISIVGVRIKSVFNLSNTEFGWVLGAFSLAYAIFEIPSGMLGDLKGQKAALIRIVLWWSLFTALTGVTTGLISLIIARFLFGMGEAGAVPNITGVLSRWFPKNEISRGVITTFAGQPAGAAIAPLIIVPIAIQFGWRATFFVNATIGIAWVIVCMLWFQNNPSSMKGITNGEKKLIEENRHYSDHQTKIPWKNILRSRSLLAVSLAHFCSQWSNYFFIAWLPVYLQQGRHFSERNMSFIVSFVFVPAIAASFGCGAFSDWLIKKRGLKFGRRFVGLFSLGMLSLFFLIDATTINNNILIVSLFIGYIFQMFFSTTSFGVCIDISGNHAGTVSAILNSIGQVGAFFMAVMFGKLVDVTHNFNTPLIVIAALLIAGALLCLLIDPAKKINFETEPIGAS
jgi:MFS transporter, ACS family, glucarate transporter